jgi:hypothetical protein
VDREQHRYRRAFAGQARHPRLHRSIAHVHSSAMTHSTCLTHSHRRLSQGKAPRAIIVVVVTAATVTAAELELTMTKLPRSYSALSIPRSAVTRVSFSSNR